MKVFLKKTGWCIKLLHAFHYKNSLIKMMGSPKQRCKYNAILSHSFFADALLSAV